MDRFRQKSKKEKPMKYVDKDPLFITDVRTIKENLKIKEILRTVKMNSSMRIKAPRGSKVMQNKDFNDNEDIFGGELNGDPNVLEPPSATNPDVIVNSTSPDTPEEQSEIVNPESEEVTSKCNENTDIVDTSIHDPINVPEGLSSIELISNEDKQNNSVVPEVNIDFLLPSEGSYVKTRDRKLSLDQTLLSRRGCLSQSELDLNSIGKSPLERKSSFFRKKMDSFLKNTTEIFKRQSSSKSQSIQRRGSMSVSLQSLHENSVCNGNYGQALHKNQEELVVSTTSLHNSLTPAQSASSLSISQSERTLPDVQSEDNSITGSRPTLASQLLGDVSSQSVHSLNEACIQDSLLNSRAISMSSGLDSAHGQSRRKSRSNRVTWLASEGLTNYLRRVIQDEKSRELNHSYQDFSSIPENNLAGPEADLKGRRLSYQRAVSGEDPRYQELNVRRKQLIPDNSEAHQELSQLLAEYSNSGVPELQGFFIANIAEEAYNYLFWAENLANFDQICDWKRLPAHEESRQAVIKELIITEADYIRHLLIIVEVFIATAHNLQDAGKLLDIDSEKLFSNIPDVLNASLYFWETTIYPMIDDAVKNNSPFNTEMMSHGFMHFRDMFHPYEKFVNDQTKALDYLRSLNNNTDFIIYLSWCQSLKACKRLQLSDIMVKPMQRLTKYSLLLRRLISNTDTEPERTSLRAMETCAKNYVQDLNRSIRQREELDKIDKLSSIIEPYEIDFRDEDMDRCFRMFTQLNLRSPMLNCAQPHPRTLIYQGDLRFKDHVKEMEVHVFLLTDFLLICKKISKPSNYQYKLIRPKVAVEKLLTFTKTSSSKSQKDLGGLVFIVVDEVGSSHYGFTLSETSKDPNPISTMKTWEFKIREARLTYEIAAYYTRYPYRDLSELDADSSSDYGLPSATKSGFKNSDDINIERDARERVATMLHRSTGASTECDFSQASMNTDSFEGEPSTSGGRPPGYHHRYPVKRTSTGGSSRNSRLSSFQRSTSAASHDEPQSGLGRYYKGGLSVEHIIPDDGVSSITVNVVSESEPETIVLNPSPQSASPQPPILVLQHSSPHKTPPHSRSQSSSRNTLRVQPHNVVMALVNSLPDLTFDPSPAPPRLQQNLSPQSASEKLYQSHQELLHKKRLAAQQHQHYLTPGHRGTSYPPPSPTRASLKRGLAFSYSFKNPPLSKMGHVNSQSQVQVDTGPSTSQGPRDDRSPTPGPSSNMEKSDKKSKNVSSRHKGGSGSRKDDKGD